MVDFLDQTQRSLIMSRVKNRNTKVEILIRSLLHRNGFRFRNNVKSLPGKPDIVLSKYKTIIFTHGCFWHGHEGCKASKLPESRRDFWEKKIRDNSERDKRNTKLLEQNGWKVIVLWQCALNSIKKRQETLATLIKEIRDN